VHHLYFQLQFIWPIDRVMVNVWNWIVYATLIWFFLPNYILYWHQCYYSRILLKMSCGELQIQMVGEHLLHHAPIGLVTFSLYTLKTRSYCSTLMPFCVMAKWNSEMLSLSLSLYLQPHQLNLRAVGTCVFGAMVAWRNNAVQYD
jgi:hypothetical protein